MADGKVFAAWTDMRSGNQDIFFSSFPLSPAPAAPNDRYEPNDAPATATDFGPVVIERHIPKLKISAGDVDFYRFTARATGTLAIEIGQEQPGARLDAELLDETGTTVGGRTSYLNDQGTVIGNDIEFPSLANHQYVLRIRSRHNLSTDYSLNVENLTGNLRGLANSRVTGAITAGDQAYYLVTADASGSLFASLSAGAGFTGKLAIQFEDPTTLEVKSSGNHSATISVNQGDQFLIHVAAVHGTTASGTFKLTVTNFDAFASANRKLVLFPAGNGPSQAVMGDVNNDKHPDLVVADGLSDTVSVLLGNGDGTFQAPRQFAVGTFVPGSTTGELLSLFRRDLVLADFNNDGNLDMAVTNKDSSDISVLLGDGEGSFAPQRRFDATSVPFGIDVGDLNGDSIPDLAVIDATNDVVSIAVLIGRGDGTFRHEQLIDTGQISVAFNGIKIADMNGDHRPDILYNGSQDEETHVLLNQGNGKFKDIASFDGGGPAIEVADLNGDDIPDVVTTSFYLDTVQYILGTKRGKFTAPVSFSGGQAPVSVKVADIASIDDNGNVIVGKPDGIPDIISAGSGAQMTSFQGPPEVMVAAGLGKPDADGNRFAPAVHLASAESPLSLAFGDLNGDGSPEIAFADKPGVQVFFPNPATFSDNSSIKSARNLGTVVHVLEPTSTIVPGHSDVFFAMKVPTEAVGHGDEVLDFDANFDHLARAGFRWKCSTTRAMYCRKANTSGWLRPRARSFMSTSSVKTAVLEDTRWTSPHYHS